MSMERNIKYKILFYVIFGEFSHCFSHCCLLNSRSFDGKTLYKWYENPTGTHEIYYILYLFYDSTKYIFIMIDDSENRKKIYMEKLYIAFGNHNSFVHEHV